MEKWRETLWKFDVCRKKGNKKENGRRKVLVENKEYPQAQSNLGNRFAGVIAKILPVLYGRIAYHDFPTEGVDVAPKIWYDDSRAKGKAAFYDRMQLRCGRAVDLQQTGLRREQVHMLL